MKILIKELYQEYPRFNVYKIYKITRDETGKIINKDFLYNEAYNKKILNQDRTLQEQIEIIRI